MTRPLWHFFFCFTQFWFWMAFFKNHYNGIFSLVNLIPHRICFLALLNHHPAEIETVWTIFTSAYKFKKWKQFKHCSHLLKNFHPPFNTCLRFNWKEKLIETKHQTPKYNNMKTFQSGISFVKFVIPNGEWRTKNSAWITINLIVRVFKINNPFMLASFDLPGKHFGF